MTTPAQMYAQIALPIPRHTLFTYRVPQDLAEACQPGCLALVPFGRGQRQGVVWRRIEKPQWQGEIRPIADILGEAPLLDRDLLHLLEWIAKYYLQPLGTVAAVALPGHLTYRRKRRAVWVGAAAEAALPPSLAPLAEAIRQRRKGLAEETLAGKLGRSGLDARLKRLERLGLIRIDEEWSGRREPSAHGLEEGPPPPADTPPRLTDEQAVAVAAVEGALAAGGFAPYLLEGITGSGKTEVYLRAVEACRQHGRQALLLVPEISLTPQLVRRYRARFQEDLAVFHSGLGEGERHRHWANLKAGRVHVAVGARSAVFAPCANLGLVVVDEEHEHSYKQAEGVPYHGRDMAVVRAREAGAVLLLGSATPSMESLANIRSGRYRHLTLTRRATGAALPRVELVNLAEEANRKALGGSRLMSPPLVAAVAEELARGRQALLFLNRRGYAPALLCRRCGHSLTCPNCSVALTLHQDRKRLVCHYCDHLAEVAEVCPQCGQLSLWAFGPGTERLEAEAKERFPAARVARLDRDAVGSGGERLEALLEAFRVGEFDILVGTQMVAKGHHFPRLALVGVALAETGLLQPDFRAAERTFQVLAQVAGRAGREEEVPGRVLIQTFDPHHYALRAVVAHDPRAFAEQELVFRQEAGYPPFQRVALVRFSSPSRQAGEALAAALRGKLPMADGVFHLGPAPAPLFKLRNRFRWQILVKEHTPRALHRGIKGLLAVMTPLAGPQVRITVDVDPYSFS